MSGWIKIHRKLLEWEWYDDTNTFRLFMHLLLKANHKDKNYRGELLKAGTVLTGRELLAKETGLSVRQVRTALTKLESTNELTSKKTSKGTKIQIVNYTKYQLTTNETTNERPTNDQQTTTNKNVKNNKEVFRAFAHLTLTVEEFEKLEQEYPKQLIESVLDKIENFKGNKKYVSLYLTAKNWLKKEEPIKKETTVGLPNMDYIKQQINLNK